MRIQASLIQFSLAHDLDSDLNFLVYFSSFSSKLWAPFLVRFRVPVSDPPSPGPLLQKPFVFIVENLRFREVLVSPYTRGYDFAWGSKCGSFFGTKKWDPELHDLGAAEQTQACNCVGFFVFTRPSGSERLKESRIYKVIKSLALGSIGTD